MGTKVKVVRRGEAFFGFLLFFSHVFILRNIMCLAPAVFVASTCLSRPIETSL